MDQIPLEENAPTIINFNRPPQALPPLSIPVHPPTNKLWKYFKNIAIIWFSIFITVNAVPFIKGIAWVFFIILPLVGAVFLLSKIAGTDMAGNEKPKDESL